MPARVSIARLLAIGLLASGPWAAACFGIARPADAQPAEPTPTATGTPTPTPTVTLTPTPSWTPTPRPGREWARVLRVWDGNTVLIEGGSSVRYLGVQTPGAGMFRRPVEPFGRQAAERNVALVEGHMVEIEQDATDVDGEGFLLRYVYVGDVLVNEVLLREGLARLAPLGGNTRYRGQLVEAEAAARNTPINLWTLPTPTSTATPTAEPTATPSATPPQPTTATAGTLTVTPTRGTVTVTPTGTLRTTTPAPIGTVIRT